MCLAVPARLIELEADLSGMIDVEGARVPVCCVMVPDARVGDWLLVHAGFAMHKLEPRDVEATWALLADLELRLQSAEPVEGRDDAH